MISSTVPHSGKATSYRNKRTGAAWVAHYDIHCQVYRFEPTGNLRAIKSPFESRSIPPYFEPAGTH
ncbi:hypothetical protein [Serratia liquefaciens]|uniref:hypothetical protein n=1 Tax=Serratia liquefaciens TaxID=614 RepID=UPI003905E613